MLHDGQSNRVAVVGGSRIPFCRAHSIYRDCSSQELMAAALMGIVNKFDIKGQTLGEVALGAVIKHSRDWNLARESLIDAGLSPRTPGLDLQRACGTSLEACAIIANKISLGQIDSGIAGGGRFHQRCARRLPGQLSANPARCRSGALNHSTHHTVVPFASQTFRT